MNTDFVLDHRVPRAPGWAPNVPAVRANYGCGSTVREFSVVPQEISWLLWENGSALLVTTAIQELGLRAEPNGETPDGPSRFCPAGETI